MRQARRPKKQGRTPGALHDIRASEIRPVFTNLREAETSQLPIAREKR